MKISVKNFLENHGLPLENQYEDPQFGQILKYEQISMKISTFSQIRNTARVKCLKSSGIANKVRLNCKKRANFIFVSLRTSRP